MFAALAELYALVFKSELSRQVHITYHITALFQTSKRKNTGSSNLKYRISYTMKPTGETVIVFVVVRVKTTVF